jgi:hypothetical protein
MSQLSNQIAKNLGGSGKLRNDLAAWMAAMEAALLDLQNQYEAHRVLTTGSVHGGADSTNTCSETVPSDMP